LGAAARRPTCARAERPCWSIESLVTRVFSAHEVSAVLFPLRPFPLITIRRGSNIVAVCRCTGLCKSRRGRGRATNNGSPRKSKREGRGGYMNAERKSDSQSTLRGFFYCPRRRLGLPRSGKTGGRRLLEDRTPRTSRQRLARTSVALDSEAALNNQERGKDRKGTALSPSTKPAKAPNDSVAAVM